MTVDKLLLDSSTESVVTIRTGPLVQDPPFCAYQFETVVEHRGAIGGHVEQAGFGSSLHETQG